MIRNILSVFAGLAIAIITFLIAESINASIHPFPADFDFTNGTSVKDYYESRPFLYWLLVLLGWGIGSFLCGLIIKVISKSPNLNLPIIASILLTLSAVANFFSFPHPIWFIIVSLLLFIPATLLGHKLFKINANGK